MTYIVTGGAGFIGSNLVHGLNRCGHTDILVVDNLATSAKFQNLHGASFSDYMDKRDFRRALRENALGVSQVEAVFHQGACSNTLVDDGVYMMDNNFSYSKDLLEFATRKGAPFIYASTAAVYGLSGPGMFTPTVKNEKPLNVYGFSKLVFDNYVRHLLAERRLEIPVVGLRYFNVYGRREGHKGRMASVIHHFSKQIRDSGRLQLFQGSGGYGNGEQRRDFVFVEDLVRLNFFFAKVGEYSVGKKHYQAIVNAGSGCSRSFNEVAYALMQVYGEVPIDYVPFPKDLTNRYQHFTEADLTGLRATGCDLIFTSLEDGVKQIFSDDK